MKTSPTMGTSSDDFREWDAETPLRELLVAGSVVWELRTNSESILRAARACFLPANSQCSAAVQMRFWADGRQAAGPLEPRPYVRGLDHLVFAGFDSGTSALVDLRTLRIIGRCSSCVAAAQLYWQRVIFPVLLSIVSGSLGMAEIHCACVARNKKGLLLLGPSGSGKSTLAVALCQAGFAFLSDDRAFCWLRGGVPVMWGMQMPFKLRPEAKKWFAELHDREPGEILNGELVFRFDTSRPFGFKSIRKCEPNLLVFLEKQNTPGFRLSLMSPQEAADRIEQDLMAESPDPTQNQAKTIQALVELPCWRLRYGGSPQVVAERLSAHCVELESNGKRPHLADGMATGPQNPIVGVLESAKTQPRRPDLLRRFTPTPHRLHLGIMGRTVRFESNSLVFLELVRGFVERYQDSVSRPINFCWRIICETDLLVPTTEVPFAACAGRCLHYVNIGQRSFLAINREARQGVGFIAQRFLEEDPRRQHHLGFDFLLYLSAAGLGLTALSAACVGIEDRCVLIFGPPNSGKTSAGYLAAKRGMEFHADQGVFLDMSTGRLRAWGDPFPAAFRPETLSFLPELRNLTAQHSYLDFTFFYMNKRRFQSLRARPLLPIGSVFLERAVSRTPRLAPVDACKLAEELRRSVVLKFENNSQAYEQTFGALGKIPAYRLQFDSDPATAAEVIRNLFDDLLSDLRVRTG